MKKPGMLLKIAAVASSLLLVTGLIAYRAGAFDRLLAKPDPAPSADTSGNTVSGTNPAIVDPAVVDPSFMSSSKSIVFRPAPKTQTPAPATPNAPPVIQNPPPVESKAKVTP